MRAETVLIAADRFQRPGARSLCGLLSIMSALTTSAPEGIYIFADANVLNNPYTGMSKDVKRRAKQHGKRIAGQFRSIGVASGTSLRDAEQFIFDLVRKESDAVDLLFKNGRVVGNKINPLNEQARDKLVRKICDR